MNYLKVGMQFKSHSEIKSSLLKILLLLLLGEEELLASSV